MVGLAQRGEVRDLRRQREVHRRAEQRLVRTVDIHLRRAAADRRLRRAVEELVSVESPVQVPRAQRAADRAAVDAGAPRRIEDVLVVRLVNGDVGEVVGPRPGPERPAQPLRQVPADFIAAPLGRGHRRAFVGVRRLVLAEVVEAQLPFRAGGGEIAVLGADALAGLREPVVKERRVLAATDRPEEGVAQSLAADGGGAVGRDQEAGCAVLVVDRVVEHRQVQHRDALHLEQRVGEQRVVVEIQHHRPGRELPPGRRLHTGGEAAVRDLVLLLADLLQRLAVEVDVGLGGPEHVALLRRLPGVLRVLEDCGPGRVVEGAGLRLRVVLEAIGRDPVLAGCEDDVAGGDEAVGLFEQLDFVGRKRLVAAVNLDLAFQTDVAFGHLLGGPAAIAAAIAEALRKTRRRQHAQRDQRQRDLSETKQRRLTLPQGFAQSTAAPSWSSTSPAR